MAKDISPVEAIALGSQVITPNDSTDIPIYKSKTATNGLYVGTSGDVKVTMADGSTVVRKNAAGGMTHPWSVTRVWATGTTATDILGEYR